MSRNYRREYSNETIARRKKRVNRNLARRIMKRKGLVKKGKLKVVSAKKNRSYPRTKTAGKLYKTS